MVLKKWLLKENDFLFMIKSKIYCSWKPVFSWRKEPEKLLPGFIRCFLIMSPSGACKDTDLGYIFDSPFLHIEETNPWIILNCADVYTCICCLYRMPELKLYEDISKLNVILVLTCLEERSDEWTILYIKMKCGKWVITWEVC